MIDYQEIKNWHHCLVRGGNLKINPMKKLFTPVVLLASIVLYTSCSVSKPFDRRVNQEQIKGRESNEELFIVKADGEKIIAKKLQYQTRTSLFPSATIANKAVAVDGKKIDFGEYTAIQTSYAYKILYRPEDSTGTTNSIYINRLRYGKINLYHYEQLGSVKNNWQRKTVYQEYVFQKENGQPKPLNYDNFAAAIKDNNAATDRLKLLFPSGSIPVTEAQKTLKNLLEIVECYNQPTTDYLQASR